MELLLNPRDHIQDLFQDYFFVLTIFFSPFSFILLPLFSAKIHFRRLNAVELWNFVQGASQLFRCAWFRASRSQIATNVFSFFLSFFLEISF